MGGILPPLARLLARKGKSETARLLKSSKRFLISRVNAHQHFKSEMNLRQGTCGLLPLRRKRNCVPCSAVQNASHPTSMLWVERGQIMLRSQHLMRSILECVCGAPLWGREACRRGVRASRRERGPVPSASLQGPRAEASLSTPESCARTMGMALSLLFCWWNGSPLPFLLYEIGRGLPIHLKSVDEL